MKRIITLFIACILLATAISSCTSSQHVGYHKNLYKRQNGCMLSDEGCAWANKARH